MRIEIVNPCDAPVGLIRWDLRKRAVDDKEARDRQKRLEKYDEEAKRKEEESKKEEAKRTKQ